MIASLEKKNGGIRQKEAEIKGLRDLIEDLRLVDLPTNNGVYTQWNKIWEGTHQIGSILYSLRSK